MKQQELVLIGGGGHCSSVIEVVESTELYRIAGIVDVKEKIGTKVSGYPVIASDDDLEKLVKQYSNFLITVGQVLSALTRIKLFTAIKEYGGTLPAVAASTAYVSKHATMGEGTVIHHKAFVNAGANIGSNCIINTGAIIEHDVVIGNHCHISTSAVMNGNSRSGNNSFIGSNAVVMQGISVGDSCVIGAGAVLLKDTGNDTLFAGNPAVMKKCYNG